MADINSKVIYVPTNPVNAVYSANEIHIHHYPSDTTVTRVTGDGNPIEIFKQTRAEDSTPDPVEKLKDRTARFIRSTLNESAALAESSGGNHTSIKWLLCEFTQTQNALVSLLNTDTSVANVEKVTIKLAALARLMFEVMQ